MPHLRDLEQVQAPERDAHAAVVHHPACTVHAGVHRRVSRVTKYTENKRGRGGWKGGRRIVGTWYIACAAVGCWCGLSPGWSVERAARFPGKYAVRAGSEGGFIPITHILDPVSSRMNRLRIPVVELVVCIRRSPIRVLRSLCFPKQRKNESLPSDDRSSQYSRHCSAPDGLSSTNLTYLLALREASSVLRTAKERHTSAPISPAAPPRTILRLSEGPSDR